MRLVNVDQPQGVRFAHISTGAGRDARAVKLQISQIARHMRVTMAAYGPQWIRGEIERALEECKEEGWDGDGGQPVTQTTAALAYMFAETLPPGLPAPIVEGGALGEVIFEWRPARGRVLIVSVYPDSTVGYATVLGDQHAHDRLPFVGELPADVLQQLKAVFNF